MQYPLAEKHSIIWMEYKLQFDTFYFTKNLSHINIQANFVKGN